LIFSRISRIFLLCRMAGKWRWYTSGT